MACQEMTLFTTGQIALDAQAFRRLIFLSVDLEEQQRVEAADIVPFEIYREKYQSTERLGIQSNLTSGE